MATRKRKKKVCAPPWVGESYDDQNKTEVAGDGYDENLSKYKKGSNSVTCAGTHSLAAPSSAGLNSKTANGRCIPGASNNTSSQDTQLSASEIIAQSMPFLQFTGSLIYSYNSGDCSLLCEDIMAAFSADECMHVGFDLEWPVTYVPGNSGKVALVQICTAEDKCYLFHIAAMGDFPRALKTLMCHPNVIKYGLNIEADFWKLERDFDIQVREVIRKSVKELGTIANVKLKSAERWTLDGLCRNVLRKRLDKNSTLRCGKWNEYPLSDEQRQYAAADAYACFLLAKHFLKV